MWVVTFFTDEGWGQLLVKDLMYSITIFKMATVHWLYSAYIRYLLTFVTLWFPGTAQ